MPVPQGMEEAQPEMEGEQMEDSGLQQILQLAEGGDPQALPQIAEIVKQLLGHQQEEEAEMVTSELGDDGLEVEEITSTSEKENADPADLAALGTPALTSVFLRASSFAAVSVPFTSSLFCSFTLLPLPTLSLFSSSLRLTLSMSVVFLLDSVELMSFFSSPLTFFAPSTSFSLALVCISFV